MIKFLMAFFLIYSFAFSAELWEQRARFDSIVFKKELAVLNKHSFDNSKFDFFTPIAKEIGVVQEFKTLISVTNIEDFLKAKAHFYASMENNAFNENIFDLVDLQNYDRNVDKDLLFATKIKKWYLGLEKEELKVKRKPLDYLYKIKYYLDEIEIKINEKLFKNAKEAILSGRKKELSKNLKQLQPMILTLKSQKLSKVKLEMAVKSFIRYNKLTAFDYKNGIDDEGNIKNSLEYTEAVIFSARTKGKILEIAPNIKKESLKKLLDIYEKILSYIQAKNNKERVAKLTKDAKELLLQATGLKEVKETPAELVANVLNSFEGIKKSLQKNNFKDAEFFRLEAYSFFDPDIEQRVMPRNPSLASKLEGLFWDGYGDVTGLGYSIVQKDKKTILSTINILTKELRIAQNLLETKLSYIGSFIQSAMIIIREGLEAILVIAILFSLFTRKKAKFYLFGGVILGIIGSFATYYLAKEIISISTSSRELIEGISALIASLMLIFVTAWIFHNTYSKGWVNYAKELTEKSMKNGSLLSLLFIGFIVIYREGFETVLFYETLSNESHSQAVLFGFLFGLFIILLVSVLIIKGIKKLPINVFFSITGIFLSLLAVIFIGAGIRGLQTANLMSATPSDYLHDWQWLRDYFGYSPTIETTFFQISIALVLLIFFIYSKQKRK